MRNPLESFIARYEPNFIDDIPAFEQSLTNALHFYGRRARAIALGHEPDVSVIDESVKVAG